MADEINELDEVRHQHHLQHRSAHDKRLAQLFWLVILASLLTRVIQRVCSWWRHRKHRSLQRKSLFIPDYVEKIAAFLKALFSISFPRLFGCITISSLSLGQVFFLTIYTCHIGALIVSVDAPRFSPHFIDDVAFRAAWITLAQVPLVYFLATKRGPLNVLAALSYERINWIHRWAGRTLFLSATAHMSIMMYSISVSDIFRSPDKVMIIVRYGVGAYGTLAWIALTSVLPLRRWSYRLFYINHWVSTSAFLWILFKHVPTYARTPIYMALGFIASDRCSSYCMFLRNNLSIRTVKRKFSKFRKGPSRKAFAMGHPVVMTTPVIGRTGTPCVASSVSRESTTVIHICDVPFSWRPGQHVRLYLPKLGKFEVHPFTPATCSGVCPSPALPEKTPDVEQDHLLSHSTAPSSRNNMVLLIRSHSGLTRRLAEYHSEWLSLPCPNSSRPTPTPTAFIDGPYGTPPAWEEYENLVLIATSTGVSFTLSIMDYLEQICSEGRTLLRTQSIRFVWAVRHLEPQFDVTVTDLLMRHSIMLREAGITVTAEFYATCPKSEVFDTGPEMPECDPFAHLRRARRNHLSERPPLRILNPDDDTEEEDLANLSPDDSDIQTRSSLESDVSLSLLDEKEDPFFSELGSPKPHSARPWWSRIPSIRFKRMLQRSATSCDCPHIRSQNQKAQPLPSTPDFVARSYGSRPNVPHLLASSASSTSREKVMVAVCSHRDVVTQAKNAVASLNFDFAAGRRERGVDIFTEGFI